MPTSVCLAKSLCPRSLTDLFLFKKNRCSVMYLIFFYKKKSGIQYNKNHNTHNRNIHLFAVSNKKHFTVKNKVKAVFLLPCFTGFHESM